MNTEQICCRVWTDNFLTHLVFPRDVHCDRDRRRDRRCDRRCDHREALCLILLTKIELVDFKYKVVLKNF